MLKTQLLKAIYLCLFCFITSSFVPCPKSTSATFITKERIDTETPISIAPIVKLNKQELQFANNYIKTSSESLVDIKGRSKMPFNIIDSVFSRYGLPRELKYLAVIESELRSSALSCVGALGPWQLMPETAHDLGLKITSQGDERTNYYKSTRAAAMYLKDLYAQFGDWLLVLAAYNAGPGPVYAAIRKSGSRNFWALQGYLPAETRGHVKRFIATHYYFEGHGSVTTLTKAENIEYAKSITAFAVLHSTNGPAAFHSAAGVVAFHSAAGVAVFHSTARVAKEKETKWPATAIAGNITANAAFSYKTSPKNEKTGNGKESPEDHFKRLMKASEESLQKASKLMEG